MDTSLLKKLQLKPEYSILIINLPEKTAPLFEGLPISTFATESAYDCVLTFVNNKNEVNALIPKALSFCKPHNHFWIAYPKKSSSIKTDLTRDSGWEILSTLRLDTVRLVSLNHDWSVFRLMKSSERTKPSTFGQDPPGVNRAAKTVIPPEDLRIALEKNPEAKIFFESLAFSHKREYVVWIHQAKKEETRKKRVHAAIELLRASKKSR